jgi:hypothetical protein
MPRRANGFKRAWVPVDMVHGGLTAMVYGFTRGPWWTLFTLFLLLSVHGAPSAPSRLSTQLPLLPLLGRALTGGERPCLRAGGSKAALEGLNAPRGLKELNRGVNGAD